MNKKLLVTTALVGIAFAAPVLAADEYKEYAPGAEISADDTGHTKGDNRISFMGDAVLKNNVTMGNYVTLHNQTKLTGDKKLTVTGYLTQTAPGSDVSGVDVEIQKGQIGSVNEGELVLGNNLTVGNLNMTDGTGVYLFADTENPAGERTLTTSDQKKVSFAADNYIKGVADTSLNLNGSGSVENNGTLTVDTALKSSVDIANNGTINLNGGYTGNGNYLGSETVDNIINIKGDVSLDNNARIVAATADDKGSIQITEAGNINLTNGSTIDAIDLDIAGTAADNRANITVGGNNPNAGREGSNNQQWRNNSYILGYGASTISNADITLNNGGHIMQGATGSGGSATGTSMTLTDSKVDINNGAMLIAHKASKFILNNTEVNLNGGNISAAVESKAASTVNVNNAGSQITSLSGDATLNLNADTSVSGLFKADSTVSKAVVAAGNTFTLDSVAASGEQDSVKLTATNLDVLGKVVVAESNANTITNTNVKGGLLDVGYNDYGSAVTLSDGGTLNLGVKNELDADGNVSGTINGKVNSLTGTTDGADANLNLVFANDYSNADAAAKKITVADSLTSNVTLGSNALYSFTSDGSAAISDNVLTSESVFVKKNSQNQVVANLTSEGVSGNDASVLGAFTTGNGSNMQFNGVAEQMAQLIQTGNSKAAGQIANQVAPETAPVVQSQATETANQVFGAVGTRLSGGSIGSAAEGKSSGDNVFERAAVWVQGLFNKSKLDTDDGFKSNSTGIALGAEKYLEGNSKAGIGYAYTDTEIKADGRKTDVDTHTAFVYGEYKPADWYVNGIASYNWSDYDETKYSGINGKYDVNSIALQAMAGYDFYVNGAVLTPEAGLRYVNIRQDSYTDTAGQRVSADSSDILTGIIGAKLKKDFALANGMNLRPEARLAMTYDMVNDSADSVVTLANGSAYQVHGEALKRFGVEAGAGLTADINDNVEVSLGYEGRFRDNYKDHTGLLNAKYKF